MSRTIEPSNNRNLNLVLLAVSLAASSAIGFALFLAMPHFRSTFSAMGFDLPWFTRAALSYYPALLAVPLAVLAAWYLWPNQSRRGVVCLAIGLGGSFVLAALLVAALQYPTFQAAQSLCGTL